ncbi:MAG: 4Fe-4S dicluster domain-containing protein [Spirochaetaceae bacterium]|nr:MAG: 4Fe-4S dicluster domain-containing protein [Spirochaetaceae bacterium]
MATAPINTNVRNFVRIDSCLCKGCKVCVETCPKHCLVIGSKMNQLGYQYARFEKETCTACGLCFYSCPEPGAITVYRNEPADREDAE